jgi:hypothetical protein
VWADRLNLRSVMIVSDLGRATVQPTLATLRLTDNAHLWHFVALAEHHFWRDLKGGVSEVARRRWM